ncbi:MAG: Nramp family divalent metal transporter, partial [Planctomycetaceae bacterium]
MSDQVAADGPEKCDGGALAPWDVGTLPEPPLFDWKRLPTMIGPGVLMAGVAIGAGEWLFGPAVSAQYGGTLLWLATLSILAQVFFNIEVMRYTLYCGEPIFVGYFRTLPGPRFWIVCYLLLEVCNIWPFMAANAAVPLTAAVLGHLPSTATEEAWVKFLGYAIFLLAFIPLIFGGTIYRMIERLMTTKVILVLSILGFLAMFLVSGENVKEVLTGFFRFGQVPLRADAVVAGRHFMFQKRDDTSTYTMQGTWSVEAREPEFAEFIVKTGNRQHKFNAVGLDQENKPPSGKAREIYEQLFERARDETRRPGQFLVVDEAVAEAGLEIRGRVTSRAERAEGAPVWQAERITTRGREGEREYHQLDDVPPPFRIRARALVHQQGSQRVGLVGYVAEHGELPDLNWAIIAAFIGIAGTGGLANTLSSNYARDKGWGMGCHVGAIPSAIGGHSVSLSHVGCVFEVDETSLPRWKQWVRHIVRDQAGMWAFCCFLGMALPCMVSREFIRNVPVAGNRAAGMTAEGIADSYPAFEQLLWPMLLMLSFIVLAPNAVFSGEAISRRWTDVIWNTSQRAKKLEGNQVRYIYYSILAAFGLWGLVALWFFN